MTYAPSETNWSAKIRLYRAISDWLLKAGGRDRSRGNSYALNFFTANDGRRGAAKTARAQADPVIVRLG